MSGRQRRRRKRDDEPEPFIGGAVVVVVFPPLGRGGRYRRYRDDGMSYPDFDLDDERRNYDYYDDYDDADDYVADDYVADADVRDRCNRCDDRYDRTDIRSYSPSRSHRRGGMGELTFALALRARLCGRRRQRPRLGRGGGGVHLLPSDVRDLYDIGLMGEVSALGWSPVRLRRYHRTATATAATTPDGTYDDDVPGGGGGGGGGGRMRIVHESPLGLLAAKDGGDGDGRGGKG